MADEVTIVVRAEDSFSGVLGNFGNIMTGIKSIVDLAGDAFRLFKDYAMEGLDAIAFYERLELALTTLAAKESLTTGEAQNMSEALAMNSEKAKELLDWMQELAIKSPFTLEGVANAFRMAQAYGFTAEEAKRLTQALIDFSAGTGANEESMSRIALALGQIEAKGKLAGQEVLQLVNAGLPVTQILADAFGVTTAEIEDMRQKGLIPAQEAIEAITVYLETNFAGAAERQAESWAGLKGTFEDIKQMGLREFFGGMFEVLQPFAIELSNWLQGPGLEKLGEWGEALGNFVQTGLDKLPALIDKIAEIKAAFESGGVVAAIEIVISEVSLQDINDALDVLDAKMAQAVNNYDWVQLGDAFGSAILGATTSGIETKSSQFIPALGQALENFLRGAVGNVYFDNSAKDLAAAFINVFIEAVKKNFQTSIQWTQDVASGIANGLLTAIQANFATSVAWLKGIINTYIIQPVKNLLGIESPSTVFFGIGTNIVFGLIAGIQAMVGPILSFINAFVSLLLAPFQPLLDLLGIDLGGGGGGTTGGFPTGGGTPSTTGAGQVVNNYYYGPVYFGAAGEPGAYYDCPSPSPLLTASASTLLGNNIG